MMEKAINLKITLPMKAQPKHSLTKVFLQTAKLEVHIENILSYKIALPTKSRRKHPKKSEFSSTLGKSTSKLKKKKKNAHFAKSRFLQKHFQRTFTFFLAIKTWDQNMQQFQNSNLHIHAKQNCFLKMKKELPKNNTTTKKLVRLMNPKIKILKPTAYHS